jgi:hypothetical protein
MDMFDRARVLQSEETAALGLTGRVGVITGITTPSVTGIHPIGGIASNCAICVSFKDLPQTFWFAPHLLEFVDHAPGTTITIGGKHLVRLASGQWVEKDSDVPPV